MSIALSVGIEGAIANYTTLKTRVAQYLDRADLDAMVPVFIAFAEAQFNRELRTPEMETGRVSVETTEEITLPANFLSLRNIYLEGSPDRPLKAMSPAALKHEYSGATGTPECYVIASGKIRLSPPPASSTTVSMDYYAKIPALSDAIPENWLLLKHPDAYLFGTLFQAEAYLDNATRAAQWKGLLDQVVGSISAAGNRNRWGAGPLVPNTTRQVRGARC
jgi:hypothetical protein